jgi:pimeloyl-ACP methyl ester carboxylesterase
MAFAIAPDGARLAYDVIGQGAPVLLIAGQASDRSVWAGTREDLAEHHRVIVFDHRGTGDSDKPDAPPYSTQGFAADAVAVLDAAGIERAHVYGISMGGRIGQWLAIDHAPRVGALILGCTTPGNAHGVRRPAEVDPVLASGDPARMRPLLVSPAWAEANPGFLAAYDAAVQARPVPPYARRLHYLASEAHDAWARLPEITAPTLIVHGTDDQVNVIDNARRLAERIPGAVLHVLPGARHAYFWEHRAIAGRVVAAFLARHPLAR